LDMQLPTRPSGTSRCSFLVFLFSVVQNEVDIQVSEGMRRFFPGSLSRVVRSIFSRRVLPWVLYNRPIRVSAAACGFFPSMLPPTLFRFAPYTRIGSNRFGHPGGIRGRCLNRTPRARPPCSPVVPLRLTMLAAMTILFSSLFHPTTWISAPTPSVEDRRVSFRDDVSLNRLLLPQGPRKKIRSSLADETLASAYAAE